jgi:hypothetical protein
VREQEDHRIEDGSLSGTVDSDERGGRVRGQRQRELIDAAEIGELESQHAERRPQPSTPEADAGGREKIVEDRGALRFGAGGEEEACGHAVVMDPRVGGSGQRVVQSKEAVLDLLVVEIVGRENVQVGERAGRGAGDAGLVVDGLCGKCCARRRDRIFRPGDRSVQVHNGLHRPGAPGVLEHLRTQAHGPATLSQVGDRGEDGRPK